MNAVDQVAVSDYVAQAGQFLARAREYLAVDDLHQAAEKGWDAAAHMAKAVAAAQGWEYTSHAHFSVVLDRVRRLTGDNRIPVLRAIANEMHGWFYQRKMFLSADDIGEGLDRIAELMVLLAPFAEEPPSPAAPR